LPCWHLRCLRIYFLAGLRHQPAARACCGVPACPSFPDAPVPLPLLFPLPYPLLCRIATGTAVVGAAAALILSALSRGRRRQYAAAAAALEEPYDPLKSWP
jgi:hypothetical protein